MKPVRTIRLWKLGAAVAIAAVATLGAVSPAMAATKASPAPQQSLSESPYDYCHRVYGPDYFPSFTIGGVWTGGCMHDM